MGIPLTKATMVRARRGCRAVHPLVKELADFQYRWGTPDRTFGPTLGYSRLGWNYLRRGLSVPSPKFFRNAGRAYPEICARVRRLRPEAFNPERLEGWVGRVARLQDSLGENPREFAGRFGYSHSYWRLVRAGVYRPSKTFYEAVIRIFPVLEDPAGVLGARGGIK